MNSIIHCTVYKAWDKIFHSLAKGKTWDFKKEYYKIIYVNKLNFILSIDKWKKLNKSKTRNLLMKLLLLYQSILSSVTLKSRTFKCILNNKKY